MKLTELVTALEDYKQRVQNAIDSLITLDSVNGSLGLASGSVIALPPPVVAAQPAAQLSEKSGHLETPLRSQEGSAKAKRIPRGVVPKAKRGRQPKTEGRERHCAKHPGNSEWDTNGGCSPCRREYQTKRRLEKGAKPRAAQSERPAAEMRAPSRPVAVAAPTPAVAVPVRRRATEKFGDEFEYSKPITCPKCKAPGIRFSRPEDFQRDTDSWTCLKNGCQVRIAHIVLSVDRGYEPDAA